MPEEDAQPAAPTSWLGRLRSVFEAAGRVPAKGSEYVVDLDTHEPQSMVPSQALTVRLARETGGTERWVWVERSYFEINRIAPPAQELDPATGKTVDIWRFRTSGEFGACFLDFHLRDPARPDAAPRRTHTVQVIVRRY